MVGVLKHLSLRVSRLPHLCPNHHFDRDIVSSLYLQKMANSDHNKHSCYCHADHRHTSRRHVNHKRQPSGKSPKDLPVKVKDTKGKPEESQAKPPAGKPWSNWIAGNNGSYFYRARQKPGGMDPRPVVLQASDDSQVSGNTTFWRDIPPMAKERCRKSKRARQRFITSHP